jgi:hypothetical protein
MGSKSKRIDNEFNEKHRSHRMDVGRRGSTMTSDRGQELREENERIEQKDDQGTQDCIHKSE